MELHIHAGANDWPAWTQAIGSVLAILIAVGVPTALWVQERLRYRRAALGLAREVVRAIDVIAQLGGVGQRVARTKEELEQDSLELTIDALDTYMRQFPVDRLGNTAAVKAFVRLSGGAGNAVAIGKAIQGGGGDRVALMAVQALAHARLAELEAELA